MIFEQRNVRESLFHDILVYIHENNTIIHNPDLRMRVIVENLMLRQYLYNPDLSYSDCRKAIQPFCREYHLNDLYIKDRSIGLGVSDRKERQSLVEWAVVLSEKIYEGMSGDHELLIEANDQLTKPYASGMSKAHPIQHRLVLTGLFELIPDLRESEERNMLLQFGKPYSVRCLNKIINSALFDTSSSEEKKRIGGDEDVEQLRRELYIARKELSDYKELTEAADAEFEDRLTALKDGEITAFFSQLTDKKYGYLIDSLFSQSRAFREIRKKSVCIPYEIEGAPIVLNNLIQFLREAGISPASPYPPNSVQRLTPAQMTGATFLPDLKRTHALSEQTGLSVRVISSGWKYKGLVIAQPVFQELNVAERVQE